MSFFRGQYFGAWAVVALAAAAGIALRELEIDPSGQRLILSRWKTTVPELCWFRRILGQSCPGCGLGRSVVSISHGQWYRAWKFHPLGPLSVIGMTGWALLTSTRTLVRSLCTSSTGCPPSVRH